MTDMTTEERMAIYWEKEAFCNRIKQMMLSKYKWDSSDLRKELQPIVDKYWKEYVKTRD